jgi:hypothetical protein
MYVDPVLSSLTKMAKNPLVKQNRTVFWLKSSGKPGELADFGHVSGHFVCHTHEEKYNRSFFF